MFIPVYPDTIMTEAQLNIFMDYVVHGIIDDLDYHVEFHGCKTTSTPVYREVEVEIPIKVPRDYSWRLEQDLKHRLERVAEHLVGTCCSLTLQKINVKLFVQLVEPIGVQLNIKPEREEKRMYIPEVNEIRHTKSKRGEFFTVIWKDNTQTTVKLMEGDTSDEYTAYLYALGKKLFGDKGTARKFVREKKKVFEDRMAEKSAEKARQRREQAMLQSLEAEDLPDISGQVYDAMFVAPCLVSRAMFRRNQ